MKTLKKQICIIGTDTGIGKTYITCNILKVLKKYNYKVKAIKPIATGVIKIGDKFLNEDAYLLSQEVNMDISDSEINPICFTLPIAPHIAAEIIKYPLSVIDVINKNNKTISNDDYDYLFIEGVGGLMVPLNKNETYINLLQSWEFPVILVVGVKLGCINHALLTYNQLKMHKVPILGWIANCVDSEMDFLINNIDYLKNKLSCPLLGVNDFQKELKPTLDFNKIFLN